MRSTVSGKEIGHRLRFKPHPSEIFMAKRDLLDYILRELGQVEGFWRYRYRAIIAKGLGISYEANTDIGEVEQDNAKGLMVVWTLRIFIPEELWVKIAWLRKNKLFKFPKPHPTIRQRERERMERAEEEEKEIEESIAEYEAGEEHGSGA